MYKKINKRTLQATQVVTLGFASIILIGAILLSLPISTTSKGSSDFLNSIFTATSATCVTGLVTVDTGTYWSTFGQVIILLLIQIGGLGFTTLATLLTIVMKNKIQFKEDLVMQESLNKLTLPGFFKLTLNITKTTLIIEGIGALFLSFDFVPRFGFVKGIWFSLFHSISAFCNAGFDIMGSAYDKFSSLTPFVSNPIVILTLALLITVGGLGFPVIFDIIKNKKFNKLTTHSKLVLTTTLWVGLIGAALILLSEFNNSHTMLNLHFGDKILSSFFQSITARTAGFNSINLNHMHDAGLLIVIILMFIGASPASTGGGIKTTTLATITLYAHSLITEKRDVEAYGKRLTTTAIRKSTGVFFIAVVTICIGTFSICLIEPQLTLTEACFQIVSAITTAGLSIIDLNSLQALSKTILILFMFIGRVGSLTILLALTKAYGRKKQEHMRFSEDRILVG